MDKTISRRTLIQFGTVASLGAVSACEGVTFPGFASAVEPSTPTEPVVPPPPRTGASAGGFQFEVQLSEPEWRARLSDQEYEILRNGGTEPRHSSPLATEERNGTYACRGCDLPIYSSSQKVVLSRGWAFFYHSYENATLTGIDRGQIEAHCRRCGSHLGHILYVESDILHCINGSALEFTPIG